MNANLPPVGRDLRRILLSYARIALPILVGALSLAGCTNGSASNTPDIESPLTLDAYQSNPCGLLTTPQAQQFGIANPSPTVFQEQCTLEDTTSVRTVELGMTNPNDPLSPQPIAQMYRNRKTTPEAFGYFDPTLVQGYPAVFADFPDQRGMGTCKITVGVSGSASISVRFSALHSAAVRPFTGDPCVQAKNIADAVVTNLKSKQPH